MLERFRAADLIAREIADLLLQPSEDPVDFGANLTGRKYGGTGEAISVLPDSNAHVYRHLTSNPGHPAFPMLLRLRSPAQFPQNGYPLRWTTGRRNWRVTWDDHMNNKIILFKCLPNRTRK